MLRAKLRSCSHGHRCIRRRIENYFFFYVSRIFPGIADSVILLWFEYAINPHNFMKIVKTIFEKTIFFIMLTTINFEGRSKKKGRNICKLSPDIEFEQDWSVGLGHGRAKVAHCVSLVGDVTSPTTAAHYVWFMCSQHRKALPGAPTAHSVHKQCKGEVHSSPLIK